MMNRFKSAVVMGLLAALPLVVQAQDPNQHMDNGASRMMRSADTHFMMEAAQGGMAEVKMGQLAAEKGSSSDVKAYGQQMVDDHTKANDRLKAIANDEGVTLPGDINLKQQTLYDKLSKLSGIDFDKEYAKSMVMDHEEDVKDFRKEANTGKDDKMKSFAAQTLPTLQQHLDTIKGIQAKLGNGSL